MPDEAQAPAPFQPPQRKKWSLGKSVLAALVVALVVSALWYAFSSHFSLLVPEAVAGSFILSLDDTILDAEGLPYSGTVLYDSTTNTYRYIATEDEGLVTPLRSGAFSSGTQYLAIRTDADSREFVLYDHVTLAPVRVIRNLSIVEAVSAVVSPDGRMLAYLISGTDTPVLTIESSDGTSSITVPQYDQPLGFSPDGTKLLTRGSETPLILNVGDLTAEPASTETSGLSYGDAETRFMLAPSGESLVAVSKVNIVWYSVDWDAATFDPIETIPLETEAPDVVFAPDSSLIVRMPGSETMDAYAYDAEEGSLHHRSLTLPLPEVAHLLHVVSW